jgi:hypothetical protein
MGLRRQEQAMSNDRSARGIPWIRRRTVVALGLAAILVAGGLGGLAPGPRQVVSATTEAGEPEPVPAADPATG